MPGEVIPAPLAATHAAVAYLRSLPGDPPLDAGVQRLAVVAACRGEGLTLVAAFEEAEEPPHPAFLAMIADLRTRPAGAVVIAATAAVFGDRVRDRARRILQLAALGVPLRLADGRQPGEALAAAWERRGPEERRRERAREGMRRRALRGEVLGRAPYGYVVVARQLEPEPGEAATVRGIFAHYLDAGEGVRRIARRLNDEGLHTRSGRPWTAGAVRQLLRNPVYTGLYRRLGIAVPRAHEALVSAERFAEAQRRMAHRRTAPSTQERRPYLLAGLARCGHCGGPLIGARRTAERAAGVEPAHYAYYRCEAATNEGRCAYHTRRAEALEAAVRAELVRATVQYPVAVLRSRPAGRGARGAALDRLLERMLERRAAGQWSDAELVRRAAPAVLEQLEHEAAEAAERDEAVDPEQARRRLLAEWDALSFERRRVLLRRAVAEVVVTDDSVRVTRRR